jgi:outer membrane autotransporter protein
VAISGNYTHSAGAIYEAETNSTGQSDKLVVTGTAVLNGGTVLVLAEPGAYRVHTNYTILTAGSLTGAFSSVASNLAFLSPSLSYDPTSVSLTLTRNDIAFADVASTANQKATASALDRIASSATGDMETVINNLLGLSASGARSAYDRMGGLTHTALLAVAFPSFNGYMGALLDRLPQGRPTAASPRNDTTLPGAKQGLWASGYGSQGERTDNDISSRYDYDTAGVAVGFDRRVSDTFLIGVAMGYSRTKVTMKDLPDDGRVWGYQGSLYGSYNNGPWYVDGVMAYGYNSYDTSRDIETGRRATADYSGNVAAAYVEAGYRIDAKGVYIIPVASFQAGYLARNGFTEEGAGALNLDVDREHAASLVSSLGLRIGKRFETVSATITPELRARWFHEFSNDEYALNASFTGYPLSAFTVRGDTLNRDSVGVGAGLTCSTTKNVSLFLAYDAIFSGDRSEHGGWLGITYRW